MSALPPKALVRECDLLTAGAVLVSVTTAAPVAQAQPTAAPEALESSQLVPRRRPPTALYHASSGLDLQRVDRWFAAALRDSASSAAPASGRARGWSTQSAQRVTLQDQPVASSSQSTESKSRSFAWPVATSQVPGPSSQLSALLTRHKTAKPR